jgi:hypothetical protein
VNAPIVLAVVATLALQRAFGAAGAPALGAVLLLPMPWIVGPTLRGRDRRWFVASFILGILWDAVVEEPVIGPGGIAWSASSAFAWWLAGTIADRSPRMWFASGVLASAVMVIVRAACLTPLGLPHGLALWSVVVTSLATGALCGISGWLLDADLPERWARHRSRRLR